MGYSYTIGVIYNAHEYKVLYYKSIQNLSL